MQIEITGEAERLIQAALASGQFASAEEFIAAMARNFQPKVKLFDIAETYAVQSTAAGTSGWDDTEMDAYDNYDAYKSKS